MANITLGQFYQAIAEGAREGTLEALKNKDFATQTTLLAVLNRLADLANEDTLDDVKGLLAALGATSDAAETDPTETASQIALLKGLLTGLNQVAGTVSDGAQKVTLTGQNVDDDSPIPLSAEVDDEGKGVLRVYNAGPHAYDVGDDVWRVTNPNPQAYSEEDDLFRVAAVGPMEDFAVLEDEVVPAGASLMLVARQTMFPENKSKLIVGITTAPGSHTQWRVSIAATASTLSTSESLKRFRSIYHPSDMSGTLPNQDSFVFVTPVWTAWFPKFEISLANLSNQDDLDVRLAWVGVGR